MILTKGPSPGGLLKIADSPAVATFITKREIQDSLPRLFLDFFHTPKKFTRRLDDHGW